MIQRYEVFTNIFDILIKQKEAEGEFVTYLDYEKEISKWRKLVDLDTKAAMKLCDRIEELEKEVEVLKGVE